MRHFNFNIKYQNVLNLVNDKWLIIAIDVIRGQFYSGR